MTNLRHEQKNCNSGARSSEHIDWPPTKDNRAEREHLLGLLRCASLQMALAKAELDSIGIALKGGLICVEYAMDWLGEIGALPLIETVLESKRA